MLSEINSPERCEARREMFGGVRTAPVQESIGTSGHQFFMTLMIPILQIVGILYCFFQGTVEFLFGLFLFLTLGSVADVACITVAKDMEHPGPLYLNKGSFLVKVVIVVVPCIMMFFL